MAADNEVNAKLNADTKEAVKEVEKLGDEFEETGDEAEEAEDKVASFGDKLSTMGGKLQSLGGALSIGVTAPIIGIAGAAVTAGINAVEAEALFETSFGNMADDVRAWSVETSDALGLNEFELRRQSATLFTMTESMGLSRDAAGDMAQKITVLAGDMASFFNTSPEEAFNKLRSGITGEAEPLKQLGILVTENFTKQTDFAKAILATGRELTEQEKVIARYNAILDQTTTASGDLERTLDSPANKFRAMGTSIEEARTKLGLALIPAVQLVIPLLETLVGWVESTVEAFTQLDPVTKSVVIGAVGIVAAIGPVIGILGTLVAAAGTVVTAWGTLGIASLTLTGVLGAMATFITGTLLPVLAAVAVGVALGGAIGIAIAEFLEWAGVIESVEEKTRKLVDAMEPSAQQVNAMAEASIIAGEKVTDWSEATRILNENNMKLREGTADAVNIAGELAKADADAASAAATLAAEEAATAKATAAAAAASTAAAAARLAEAKAAQTLATQLGVSGLEGSMRKTSAALDVLNQRGERLSSSGLDKVIKQVQKLKAESIPLTGALKAWDDRVKAATANLPPLSGVIEDIPLPELTDEMIAADAAAVDFGDTTGVTGASLAALGDDMTKAQRAAIGLPPVIIEGADAAELMSGVLMDTANAMQIFGISADSAIGQIIGLSSTFTAAIPAITNFNKSILGDESLSRSEKFAGAASGIASGISAVASATGSGGAGASAAKGALAGATAGAQIGGPIGAGVGAAAGAIVGFFRGRGRDKIRKAVSDAVGADVSEDLSQSIKDAAKEAGTDIQTQSLLSLGDIFRDVGVEEFRDGAMGAANAVGDLMQGVADGSIDAKEGVAAIGDAFSELAGQTLEAGRVADAGLIQLVKNARELGQDVPEIAAFVEASLLDAAQGISKVIGGIKIVDPQDAQDQATIFAGAFFATVEEVGLLAAVDAFEPAFKELKAQLQEVGIEGTDFGGVGRLFEIAGKEEFRPLLEGVEGLNQALVGMANSGFLTADSFSAFQRQAGSAFEQLQEAGLNSTEALQQMAPTLQSAIDASERFGIPLDENTQKMIAQAEAAGIAFETDPMNRMADALVLVAELLGATEEQLSGLGETAGGVADSMGGIGENIAELPDVANQSVEGVKEAFMTGSEGIVEGLAPISDTMANEIRAAGEETSTAIDASFSSTNEAIKTGLGEVSDTFIFGVVPAALAAAMATDKIAESAKSAAAAAKGIQFPGGGPDGSEDVSAAAGFRGVLGADTLIQAHRGEFVNIIPAAQTSTMDFASAQGGMGPGASAEREPNISMGNTTIMLQASGNRREDDRTVDKLIKELAAEDGRKRAELQRMLGVKR